MVADRQRLCALYNLTDHIKKLTGCSEIGAVGGVNKLSRAMDVFSEVTLPYNLALQWLSCMAMYLFFILRAPLKMRSQPQRI